MASFLEFIISGKFSFELLFQISLQTFSKRFSSWLINWNVNIILEPFIGMRMDFILNGIISSSNGLYIPFSLLQSAVFLEIIN